MKNISTKAFCQEFGACCQGTRFALRFDTMRECYAALLSGEAGENSAEWAIWTATRPGVMGDRDLRLFAVRCARRVKHLMKDQRSISALVVAERYANGEETGEELDAARAAAEDAARTAKDATGVAAWTAADAAASVAADAAASVAAWEAARAEGRAEQLKILKGFGNPFEEAEK